MKMKFDEKLRMRSGTRRAEIIPRKWYRISFLVLVGGLAGTLIFGVIGAKTDWGWAAKLSAICLLGSFTSYPIVKIKCRCPCCGNTKHTKILCWSGYNKMYCSKCGAILMYDDDPDKDRDLDELEAEEAAQEHAEALAREEKKRNRKSR